MESLITRFDKDNPCWTAGLLAKAGEDISPLPELVKSGFLRLNGEIYSLTGAGAEQFRRAAAELFIEAECGLNPVNPGRSLARTKLRVLLDSAHWQRWGLKEFYAGQELAYLPDLRGEEIFSLTDDKLTWRYQDSPVYRKITENFPPADIDKRSPELVPPARIAGFSSGHSLNPGALSVDLLYLSRYDFMFYQDFKGHPNDPLKLINADRFLFVFPEKEVEANIETIGKFHLWLNYIRRVQIPGYADCDTQEQLSVSWLVFATATEEESARVREALSKFGEDLVRPARPCEIWTISFEALEKNEEKQEVISELFCSAAQPVRRDI